MKPAGPSSGAEEDILPECPLILVSQSLGFDTVSPEVLQRHPHPTQFIMTGHMIHSHPVGGTSSHAIHVTPLDLCLCITATPPTQHLTPMLNSSIYL